MTRALLLTFVLAFFAILISLMVIGWTARRRRQRGLPQLQSVPVDIGEVTSRYDGFYVSTTPRGAPLERIAVRGLGFRARATVTVAERGVVVSLPANDFFIAAESLREATTARYTIDRVVEEGGLALISWMLGDVALDSYFRVEATQRLVDDVAALVIPSNSESEQA